MSGSGKEWIRVDKLLRNYLLIDDTDICFYYLLRTSGGFLASEANNRIDNFKKKPSLCAINPSVASYKEEAIKEFADDVLRLLDGGKFRSLIDSFGATLVPIPTSKPRNHEEYDSRLEDLCSIVAERMNNVFVENSFDMIKAVRPSHEGGIRQVDFLKDSISFNGLTFPSSLIILVDDVLLTGSHYLACKQLIKEKYPDALIVGVFLAFHKSDHVDYGQVDFGEMN